MDPSGITISCSSNCDSSSSTITFDEDLRKLTLEDIFTSYVTGGDTVTFDLGGFINPDIAGSYYFTITSYEDSSGTFEKIDTITDIYVEIKALSVISILKIKPAFLTMFIPTFKFLISSPVDLECTYTMTIYLPTNFQLGKSDTDTCKLKGTDATNPTCTMDTTEKSITLANFCDTTIAADTEFSFKVNKI
eukprot:CAMPEP_0202963904 /NCGR_PEP_ID=MMETSP1396-20130829/7959_1 /ASSEMBLY_ACC=CAM_ASM_000872 /TAXON_ID= /ORGANISM="Pseudokeronopsis sp., Strain Brazil" /LENGTH=190 /DNA_ID=CAMNT_0049685551 /DNA_START=1052 /DNA_END=1624 /DNA_ORIENTATION=+